MKKVICRKGMPRSGIGTWSPPLSPKTLTQFLARFSLSRLLCIKRQKRKDHLMGRGKGCRQNKKKRPSLSCSPFSFFRLVHAHYPRRGESFALFCHEPRGTVRQREKMRVRLMPLQQRPVSAATRRFRRSLSVSLTLPVPQEPDQPFANYRASQKVK